MSLRPERTAPRSRYRQRRNASDSFAAPVAHWRFISTAEAPWTSPRARSPVTERKASESEAADVSRRRDWFGSSEVLSNTDEPPIDGASEHLVAKVLRPKDVACCDELAS